MKTDRFTNFDGRNECSKSCISEQVTPNNKFSAYFPYLKSNILVQVCDNYLQKRKKEVLYHIHFLL